VPKRVLIVDDEPYILHILAFKLRRAGYTALEALSVEAALAILATTPVNCVILDVGLATPAAGFDLAAVIRDDPRTCRIPIIFLTARSLPADVRRGEALGARAYITKPFSLDDVLAEVERQLDATPAHS
jgi:DNA-binding response OmpR family regulator